jgi:hypothetical protein
MLGFQRENKVKNERKFGVNLVPNIICAAA